MEISKTLGRMFPFVKSKGLDTSGKNYFPTAAPSDGDGAGWHSLDGVTIDSAHNDYENAFDNMTKISDSFSVVLPYLMGSDGKPISESTILDAVYSPNTKMDAVEFRKALALMRLAHDEFYVRVHFKGDRNAGKIRPESIIGFSFIEVAPTKMRGKLYFYLKNGDMVTDDEVMVFRSLNPYNLAKGFSPARASRRWTLLDDYIADYQAGFFRNGAVPAGQFIITARTVQEFKDIKAMLEKKHKGASKNNNVTYSHRTIDAETGKPLNAAIEWVPFKTSNKDLALKELMEVTTRRTDSSFGVPAEIRGHLQSSNYASVTVAEKVYVKYTLYPFTLALWSKFTHELARVTGGFGAAFAFNMEIPTISEELEQKANAQKTEVESLKLLLEEGYTLESAVAALKLDKSYLDLKNKKPSTTEDKPEVQQTGEAKNEAVPDDYDTPSISKAMKIAALDPEVRVSYVRQMSTAIQSRMNEQIRNASDNLGTLTKAISANSPIEAAEDDLLAKDMFDLLEKLVKEYGTQEHVEGLSLVAKAGVPTDPDWQFTLTPEQAADYSKYLLRIAKGYNGETSTLIRDLLAQSMADGLPVVQIKEKLAELITGSMAEYRINRLAVSEVNRAQNRASVAAMSQIQGETGHEIVKKVKNFGSDPCPLCKAMAAMPAVPVDDTFWEEDAEVTGADGKTYVNKFVSAYTADFHPHCECSQVYEVVKA